MTITIIMVFLHPFDMDTTITSNYGGNYKLDWVGALPTVMDLKMAELSL